MTVGDFVQYHGKHSQYYFMQGHIRSVRRFGYVYVDPTPETQSALVERGATRRWNWEHGWPMDSWQLAEIPDFELEFSI